jgi:drug/metabolite transporter (DMT)-like permease
MIVFERQRMAGFASLNLIVWATLLTIAILSLSVSTLLYFWVIERIDVTEASLSIYLLPVFGVLLSTVFVREKTTAQLVLVGLLVFAGTFLATVYEERRRMRMQASQEGEQGWQKGTSSR